MEESFTSTAALVVSLVRFSVFVSSSTTFSTSSRFCGLQPSNCDWSTIAAAEGVRLCIPPKARPITRTDPFINSSDFERGAAGWPAGSRHDTALSSNNAKRRGGGGEDDVSMLSASSHEWNSGCDRDVSEPEDDVDHKVHNPPSLIHVTASFTVYF